MLACLHLSPSQKMSHKSCDQVEECYMTIAISVVPATPPPPLPPLLSNPNPNDSPGHCRWGDGLHQAVEAKERLPIQNETITLASISYQVWSSSITIHFCAHAVSSLARPLSSFLCHSPFQMLLSASGNSEMTTLWLGLSVAQLICDRNDNQ